MPNPRPSARQATSVNPAWPATASIANDSHGPAGRAWTSSGSGRAAANTNGPGVKNQRPRPGSEPDATPIEVDSAADWTIRPGSPGPPGTSDANHAPLISSPLARGPTTRPDSSDTVVRSRGPVPAS